MGVIHLHRGGTSVLLETGGPGLPRILHIGEELVLAPDADLDALAAALIPPVVSDSTDEPPRRSVMPEASAGWLGTPGISGDFDGLHALTHMVLDGVDAGGAAATVRAHDDRLNLTWQILLSAGGLAQIRAVLTNTSRTPFRLAATDLSIPAGDEATELLSLEGRHLRERHPQRSSFIVGHTEFATRRGRTGLQAPTLLMAGEPGFDFDRGRIWAIHLGWSGNQRIWAERGHDGPAALGGGELIMPGEIRLGPGDSYTSPWLFASHGTGVDQVAARFHDWLRATPGRATRPRPVTLNTWEAVYFDQNLADLSELARLAGSVGVERFVLDDGWFGARRDDSAGLGDWTVSPEMWPEGLDPLIDAVRSQGMEFGLWVEPEMVSADSELARLHPDWILGESGHTPMPARHQQVLDLANPDAWAYIHAALDALLTRYSIGYLKWDNNRDIHEPVDPRGAGRAHAQVDAFYRLVDRLRADHPGLEIESCSSGGGRVDLEVLSRTDRIWVSDCIDPMERQTIQTWTSALVPPELMGCHIGAPVSHTTGRTHSLATRATTALLGHLGVEWDLRDASEADLAALSGWIAIHKRLRGLISTGRLLHRAGPTRTVTALVSRDAATAAVVVAQTATGNRYPAEPLRIPGLDAARTYRLTAHGVEGHLLPPWLADGTSPELPGSLLTGVGVAAPELPPENSWLLVVEDASQASGQNRKETT
ncbi:Alpha-galactosidase [Acidipropionibacterium acidipropionici ATCC 4875]|uniref:alpha-galactosidase n=1 Tax=Acidipropionibacterium acidipropionici (strain ATCC 4875 / DSM 20272 / JCM 6432 / NBRC 12425 / NCIMB 8070 / 4) TaxID=1171373 RepID=K7RUC1_ACIA4|nr:alpha-galactosidase [Acidipropionibacterium acidipropionici]AFV88528.1 Alpha-galactosidase [Acidipropionibacterium acidipropionici ATCC 4875]